MIEEGGGGDAEGSNGRNSQRLKKIGTGPLEIISALVAFVSVGASVTGIIMTGFGTITIVSGILTSLISPYAYYQQTQLTNIRGLKEAHESVRREVNRLENENNRLNETIGQLNQTMDGLEEVEGALDVITQTQGASIETFKQQVEENRDILSQLRKQLRASVLQNLLEVVLRSDADDNMTIEEDEIEPLIERIKKINGVEVNEPKFKEKIIQTGGSLAKVMEIIKNLMSDTGDAEGDAIFKIKEGM